ncbi:MAG TPA: hypothetical protein VIF57_19080 [Polyangia bacterium]|jgi:hypothetical protein
MRSLASIAALVLGLLAAASARAELRYRVVLLRPPVTDDVTSDALARVHGELTAAGFDVSMLAQDPTLDVRGALETVGRELDPIAAFAIVRGANPNTAEIWVCDRLAGKSVIQSVRLDADGRSGQSSRSVVLAVQAVELLKASLAQYWLASVRRAPPPPPDTGVVAPGPRSVLAGVGIEAGLGWLDSMGAVTAAWQPIVRASYGGPHGWAGRVTVGGLGTESTLSAPTGTAQIRQELAALEIVRGFRPGARVQPVVSAGGGVFRARVEGTGVPDPSTGLTSSNWSALVTAGIGVVVPIVAHAALVADAHLIATWPYTAVRFGTVEASNIGWPSLLASAGVLATF